MPPVSILDRTNPLSPLAGLPLASLPPMVPATPLAPNPSALGQVPTRQPGPIGPASIPRLGTAPSFVSPTQFATPQPSPQPDTVGRRPSGQTLVGQSQPQIDREPATSRIQGVQNQFASGLEGLLGASLAQAAGPGLPQPTQTTVGRGGSTDTPDALKGFSNGELSNDVLASVGQGGHRLYTPAAQAWQALVQAAAQEGVDISITDSYRTYAEQVDLAKRKGLYSQGGLAAVPGTSEHGWGLAVDANVNDPRTLQWLRANAGRFGFGQPGGADFAKREPWHWEWQGGGPRTATMANVASSPLQGMGMGMGMGTGGGFNPRTTNPYVTQNPYLNQSQAQSALDSGLSSILQAAGSLLGGGGGGGQSGIAGFGAVQNPNSAKYGPTQIAQVARNAGFAGNDLVTMVAIAMAESGGNVGAHNPKGEDSRGLWQVNVAAHGEKYGNLYDPQINANAAFDIWKRSGGFSPWTVTHEKRGAPYRKYLSAARAAVQALGWL